MVPGQGQLCRIDTFLVSAQYLERIDGIRSNFAYAQAFKRALLFLLFLLFPVLFLCSYFFLLFSENALLFSPKMFEVTKNCNFFHAVFARLQFLKIRST